MKALKVVGLVILGLAGLKFLMLVVVGVFYATAGL